ncbi:MAG: hypothetical protein R3176_11580 [Woeseiaceae bacterium]|nr:hypothetical protein [Woeseiaceae bacterium]
MEISWHQSFAESWLERRARGRAPHAVLLIGPRGVGKRAAAAWLARHHLGLNRIPELPEYPVVVPEHADLRWIGPAEDKTTIGIEQIRDLVAELSLTSYAGNGKVAIIAPANVMTANAANSLLKTLEEPPGNTLIVLVADRLGRLPATILSRCQRIDIVPPPEAEGLAWLDRLRPGTGWVEALQVAGLAPLAAISALESMDAHERLSRDFAAVATGSGSVVSVAKAWAALEPVFVLDWLARQLQAIVTAVFGGPRRPGFRAIDDSVLGRMDRQNLFCYLDTINRLRAQPAGSFNVQLALEGLLVDLADGLKQCRDRLPEDGMRHLRTEKR